MNRKTDRKLHPVAHTCAIESGQFIWVKAVSSTNPFTAVPIAAIKKNLVEAPMCPRVL